MIPIFNTICYKKQPLINKINNGCYSRGISGTVCINIKYKLVLFKVDSDIYTIHIVLYFI